MTPLLGGLGAALGWASATLCAAGSSRRIGGMPTLAWVMLSGFLVSAPIAAATGWPAGLDGPAAGWLALAGGGNVAGLALLYAAMRTAEVGVLASIASTEGALAALIAIAAGERPALRHQHRLRPAAGGRGAGRGRAGREGAGAGGRGTGRRSRWRRARRASSASASSPPAGRASRSPSAGWRSRPGWWASSSWPAPSPPAPGRWSRPASGTWPSRPAGLRVLGILSFAWGARDGIAITSVVSSQFAALAALGAFLLFGERLVLRQLLGVGALAVGVAMVAVGSA